MMAQYPATLAKQRLKVWLKLLAVTREAEKHLREFLRVQHNTTLPRFDVMAALYRKRSDVTMSELSRLLLVSNGNVTAVVDRLERDGLARRTTSKTDRRTIFVTLTSAGLMQFENLAKNHEREIDGLFSDLNEADLAALSTLLKRANKGQKR